MQKEQNSTIPTAGFMRLSQVLKVIPVCKTAWYRGIHEGIYPKPVPLGPRTAAYRAEDIHALITRLGNGGAQHAQ